MTTTATPTASTDSVGAAIAERRNSPERAGKTMAEHVRDHREAIASMLGSEAKADRFISVALHHYNENGSLKNVTMPLTILGAIMRAASLRLDFTLDTCYIGPRKKKVGSGWATVAQFQLGYKGIIDLARRSQEIKEIVARPVYAGEPFQIWTDELGDHMRHERHPELQTGDILFHYSLAVFTNGGSNIQIATLEDVAKRREASDMGTSEYGPWVKWPVEMANKTAVRMQSPWLPLSVEARQGIEADETVVEYTPSGFIREAPSPAEEPQPPDGLDAGTPTLGRENVLENIVGYMEALEPKDRNACGSYLLRTYGSLDRVPDEQLATVLEIARDWAEKGQPGGGPQTASDAPGAPGGAEPPSEAPAGRDGADLGESGQTGDPQPGPSGRIDEDLLDKTQRVIETWTPEQVDRISREWEIPVQGKIEARRLRLVERLTRERQAGNQAAIDLF